MSGGNGPLDSMRSLEQFLPGEQPRGFMGPDGGPKGNFLFFLKKRIFYIFSNVFFNNSGCPPHITNSFQMKGILFGVNTYFFSPPFCVFLFI